MYILKIILSMGVFSICVYIGKVYSQRLKNIVNEYIKLEDILNYIESKIKYLEIDVINIFSNIIDINDNYKYKKLFSDILKEISNNEQSLYECWAKSKIANEKFFSCDLNPFDELFKYLGKTNVAEQLKIIECIKVRIKSLIELSKENELKNEKLYKNLGIICGLMLVIVII